jgi:hypothetical protein
MQQRLDILTGSAQQGRIIQSRGACGAVVQVRSNLAPIW